MPRGNLFARRPQGPAYRPLAAAFWPSVLKGAGGGFALAVCFLLIGLVRVALAGAPGVENADEVVAATQFMGVYAAAITPGGALVGGIRYLWPTRFGYYVAFMVGGAVAVTSFALSESTSPGDALTFHPLLLVGGAFIGAAAGAGAERAERTA